MNRLEILNQVSIERENQESEFGKVNKACDLWQLMVLFGEEAGECQKALCDAYDWERRAFEPIPLRQLRRELIQAAAMAVQIIERLDTAGYSINEPGRTI